MKIFIDFLITLFFNSKVIRNFCVLMILINWRLCGLWAGLILFALFGGFFLQQYYC